MTHFLPVVINKSTQYIDKRIYEKETKSVNSDRINFINPNKKEVHTQTIEGFWSKLKKFIREKETNTKQNIN